MNCEHYRELLVSELCGEIQNPEGDELRDHLQHCEDCRQAQLEFRGTLGLMRQLPQGEWNEKLRIKDLLRREQRWRQVILSKAALWLIGLVAVIGVVSYLPVHWEVSDHSFSLQWGDRPTREEELSGRLKELQMQLAGIRKQTQEREQLSDMRIRQLLEQNNVQQQKRYWETLQMFTTYMQYQRKADLQKIQHDIATTYDRTGEEMGRTNELLQFVLRASSSGESSLYDGN